YQIFTGDLDGLVLSNIIWGEGVDSTALLEALRTNTAFGSGEANKFYSCETAKDVATVLAEATFRANPRNVEAFADVAGENLSDTIAGESDANGTTYTIDVENPGYYLIKDIGDVSGHDSYTKYILEIVADTTVSPKSAVPTLTKHVSADGTNYAKGVNTLYGNKVTFQLIGTMPSNIAAYDNYYYEIVDVLPAGLTVDALADKHTLTVENNGVKNKIKSVDYQLVYNPDGDASTSDFAVVIKDVKAAILGATGIDAITEDRIIFTYEATLQNNAVLGVGSVYGALGNENVAYLKFSNDPNEKYDPTEGVKPKVGTTPGDIARVYTYQLTVNKVDQEDPTKNLSGATFQLYRIDGVTKMYAMAEEISSGSGIYEYVKTTDDVAEATPLTTNKNGTLTIKGLSARALHLSEITSPSGYNKPNEDIGVTISAGIESDGSLKTLNGILTSGTAFSSVAADVTDGSVAVTITNTKGQTLPETGGVGTTVFYVIGAVLVIGAAAALIVRKRGSERR
ncbi:MAG: isopeptide-forming domain-containing fimbrial protein, partial [Eggerthellaceae bacterium]|nr:isopeptide-forming domain-containing fimbrial protein [Eggerthellaceae bacterium]